MDKDASHPLWVAYDNAAKRLWALAGSSPLAARTNAEQNYALAYKRLVQAGLSGKLKKKYRR